MRPSRDARSVERKRALVVGVNHAPEAQDPVLHTLLHAAEDARAVAQALRLYGGFEIWGDKALVNEQATAYAVKRAIIQLEEGSTRDDFLLFYFGGHGLLRPASDDLTDDPIAEAYLATWDFSETMTRGDLCLSLRWLRNFLYRSAKAGKVVIILDSCYAGDFGRVSRSSVERVREALFFEEPPGDTGSLQGGLRQALLATGHAQTTREEQGRGLMTTYLLRALEGEADEAIDPHTGEVTLTGIQHYFEQAMPAGELATLTGNANKKAVLALHVQRVEELRRRAQSQRQPRNYIPFQRDPHLQLRTDELEGPDSLLARLQQYRLVGLVGRRGVGKSWLARELAFRCEDTDLYPGGIFWMSSGENDYTSCVQELEHLALGTEYLPPNDDGGRRSDYEEQRARHFCRYLAGAEQALLIIHNLKHSNVLQKILPGLAGGSLRCTVVYTALPGDISEIGGAHEYPVKPSERVALTLLLRDVRSAVLACYEQQDLNDSEVRAAREICSYVDSLPLPLLSLRTRLQDDPELSLAALHTLLQERGVLNEIGNFKAFWHSNWEDLEREEQRDFLLLAALFPADTPVALWLLELAAGIGQSAPLAREIYRPLERLGWIEIEQGQGEQRIILGQAQQEFGESILQDYPQRAHNVKRQAARRLVQEFTDVDRLQERCRSRDMYWQCLSRQQQVRRFAQLLDETAARAIESVERCLDQGSALLVQEQRWTEGLPELFYQYLHNWSVERGISLTGQEPARWICLEQAVGNEDRALLRTLSGHEGGVTCVAYSPDEQEQEILTAARDGDAYLWEATTGRLRFPLRAHKAGVTCVTFAADNRQVITGSRDCTIRVWDRQSGVLMYTWQRHRAGITCLACSADGLLIAGSNDGRVSAGSLTDGTVEYWQTPEPVSALALARRWLAVASGDTIWLREQAAGRPSRLWQSQNASVRVTHLALSSDERFLAFCTTDRPRVVNLWDCEHRVMARTLCGHSASITSIAFTPGQQLLSGAQDATARLWNIFSGQCQAIFTGHTAAISSVASSPDGRLVLSGSLEGAAHVWDREMAQQGSSSFGLQQDLHAEAGCASTDGGALIAPQHTCALVVCGSGAQLWSTEQRTCMARLNIQGAERLAFSAHEDLLLVKGTCRSEVYTWSQEGLRQEERTAAEVERLWNEVSAVLPLCGDLQSTAQGIALPGSSRYRLVARGEGRLSVIDTSTAEQANETGGTDWPVEAGPITHLSFSPDGRLLAAGDQRGYLLFLAWSGRRPGPLVGLYKAAGQVAALSWLGTERVLLVDASPAGLPPHFHWLHLKGMHPRIENY